MRPLPKFDNPSQCCGHAMILLKVSLLMSMKLCGGETVPQAPASAQLIFLIPFQYSHLQYGRADAAPLTTCLAFFQCRSSGNLLGV